MPSDFLTMPGYPAPRFSVTFPPKTWLLVLLFLPVLGLCVVFDLAYFLSLECDRPRHADAIA